MERSRIFSTAAILIGVAIVALIAGFNFSLYSNDREIMDNENRTSLALPLAQLDRSLLHFDHLFHDIFDGVVDFDDEQKALILTLDELDQALATFDENPTMRQDEELAKIVQEVHDFEKDAREFFSQEKISAQDLKAEFRDYHLFINEVSAALTVQIAKEDQRESLLLNELRNATSRSLLTSFLSVLIALVGMAYFARLSSQNESLASKNQDLIHRTNALSDAKSRLLTMLSHEIRTPLNGIVGLSNLALQSPKADEQITMIEAIQNSSLDLTKVVSEMLEFTDFSTMSVDSHRQMIIFSQFLQNLRKELDKVAEGYDKRITINVDPDCPELFVSDYARLYRGFFFLFSYLIEKTPEIEINAEFSMDRNLLMLKSDFHFLYEFDSDWRLEHIGEAVEDDPNRITLDGIESTMARGLLESLGSNIRVLHNEQDSSEHRLLVDVPIERSVPVPIFIAKLPKNLELPHNLQESLKRFSYKFVDELDVAHIIFAKFGDEPQSDLKMLREIALDATIIGVNPDSDLDLYHYNVCVR